MTLHIRRRTPPSPHQILYGPFSKQMTEGGKYYKDARNRAAYVYITGQFPSHLRKEAISFLRHATKWFKKPVSLDGRTGKLQLSDAIVRDLDLNQHPMVLAVRKKISQGYLIQPSLGIGTRRNYGKTYMFKFNSDHRPVDLKTIKIDGAERQGW